MSSRNKIMSVEATITFNDKIEPIRLMSKNKEEFVNELNEKVREALSTIDIDAEIISVMRIVTQTTKIS